MIVNFNMKRQSGVLLHPTALSGPFGIGELGPDAYRFIDHLADMGQSLWQILPIGPADLHNSPYSSSSTFAGNHLLISLQLLVEDGLLDFKLLDRGREANLNKINFDNVIRFKMPLLKKTSKNFEKNASSAMKISFENFCNNQFFWLDDYSKYWALKEENNQACWSDWKSYEVKNLNYILEAKIIQFIFYDHWSRLRNHAKGKGVQIVGDMPIYVGYDSADVCFNRNLFLLDQEGKMEYQAGCPPCEYQKEGQLWGTPLYNWKNHESTNFRWWQQRFKKLFEMVDIIRLDHFIGYAKYYRIPINHKTAHGGEWLNAPGDKLFETISPHIDNFNVISEDLGDVTQDVIDLRNKHHFPGMRVLQFESFKNLSTNNFSENSIVFTGTHDNDTIMGWFESLPKNDGGEDVITQDRLLDFFKCSRDDIHWEIISYAFNTKSNTIIVPVQDILGETSSARFNVPGTLSIDNWSWRLEEQKLTKFIKEKLAKLTEDRNRDSRLFNHL